MEHIYWREGQASPVQGRRWVCAGVRGCVPGCVTACVLYSLRHSRQYSTRTLIARCFGAHTQRGVACVTHNTNLTMINLLLRRESPAVSVSEPMTYKVLTERPNFYEEVQ